MSPPTKAEVASLGQAVATVDKLVEVTRKEVEFVRADTDEGKRYLDKIRDQVADLQAAVAVLNQKVDDLRAKSDEAGRRLWTLVGLVVAAALSFAANLVVAFIRK